MAHEMVAVSADLDLRVVQLEPDLALAPPATTSSVKLLTQSSEHAFSRWTGALGALAAGRAVVELKRRDQLILLEDCDLASTDQAVSRGAHAARLRQRGLPLSWVGLAPRDDLRRSGRNQRGQISLETVLDPGHEMRRFGAQWRAQFEGLQPKELTCPRTPTHSS